MRFKALTFAGMFLFAVIIMTATSLSVVAQEGEVQVIDEVVVQVNDDVITLSRLKRETKERVEALKQAGMSEQQALAEAAKKQPELIVILINEQLLLQKGKELDLASDIEAAVNRRMLDIAREQGITSIEKLEQAMKQSGLEPSVVRQTMRSEMMKQAVFQQEVDRVIFYGPSAEDVKKFFEANREKFRTSESVKLSEIFLSSTNKDEAAVRARAMELLTQLRAGADFRALASANSEREKDGVRSAPKDGGLAGVFEVPSLREDIAAAIKTVKVGGVTDVLKLPDGFQILRLDERTPAGATIKFEENKVREAMMVERQPKEREAFLDKLRNDAFIKISETYRASVEPLLKLATRTSAKTDEKSENKNKKP